MAKKGKKISKWKYRYRFIIYNDRTFEEVWQMRLSKLNIFLLIGSLVVLLIALTTVLIAFTNLREFIPGYPDGNMRRNIVMNAYRLDSLENELRIRDQYFENLSSIISGEEPNSYNPEQDTNIAIGEISFATSLEDSLLRHQIEVEELYNLSVEETEESEKSSLDQHFFTPMKGIVTSSFNAIENHFGTDVVGSPNAVVSATLDGTIILASWTLETGYVIQIQHENNLVSVYKHNAELLKEVGSFVRAGESIAIIGNSGELFSTGPHLHFELWYNGTPLDPEKYVVF
ncbi:MAG: M23 family metallopeptidase [Bacteroidales bacterium]|nr:MAG: M23 family metallopeptidase [Bacteroidales bacterium]